MKFFKKLMNMEIATYQGVGQYNVPYIQPMKAEDFDKRAIFEQFHKAVTIKQNRKRYSVHFFVDDYQFERCWTSPQKYTDMLLQFDYVMEPDFSMYIDMPKAIQVFNHYRSQWLGRWWQDNGVKVIPTAIWSDQESYSWCFDGLPKHSVIATLSMGTQADAACKRFFLNGFNEMRKRLEPSLILLYGHVPKELQGDATIFNIKPFYEDAKKRCVMNQKLKKAFMKGVK